MVSPGCPFCGHVSVVWVLTTVPHGLSTDFFLSFWNILNYFLSSHCLCPISVVTIPSSMSSGLLNKMVYVSVLLPVSLLALVIYFCVATPNLEVQTRYLLSSPPHPALSNTPCIHFLHTLLLFTLIDSTPLHFFSNTAKFNDRNILEFSGVFPKPWIVSTFDTKQVPDASQSRHAYMWVSSQVDGGGCLIFFFYWKVH